jgi:anti-anti-sigma regulatory factor
MPVPSHIITLPARLEMTGVVALHQQLLEALRAGVAVTVDGSQVASVDTASAQALVAFALSAREARVEVSWSRSEPLDAFLSRTALSAALTAERT